MAIQLTPGIRNCVRAVIVHNERLLVLRKVYADGRNGFALPGGAQDLGETLEQALQRECLEEIGTTVDIHGLLHLADFFKPRDTQPLEYRHQLEILFHCSVPGDYQPANGPHPDKHQTAVEWLARDELVGSALFPAALGEILQQLGNHRLPAYLGQIRDE